MILANLVKVLVIGQAAGVTVGPSTVLAGEGSTSALRWVNVLGPGGSGRGVGFLEAMLLAVLDSHAGVVVAFGRFSSHGLELGGPSLLKSGAVGRHALEPLVTHLSLGSMFLMETQVVDQLLLNLEGLATFLTLVPTAEGVRKESNMRMGLAAQHWL